MDISILATYCCICTQEHPCYSKKDTSRPSLNMPYPSDLLLLLSLFLFHLLPPLGLFDLALQLLPSFFFKLLVPLRLNNRRNVLHTLGAVLVSLPDPKPIPVHTAAYSLKQFLQGTAGVISFKESMFPLEYFKNSL